MASLAESSAPLNDQVEIVCLYCHKAQPASRRALSIPCHFCHKTLRLEDLAFGGYEARRVIETCGTVIIEPNGNLIVDRIACGDLVVRGRLKGAIWCRGTVWAQSTADLRGDVTASSLRVDGGARLAGQYAIGPHEGG
jgi:hypothetical protein